MKLRPERTLVLLLLQKLKAYNGSHMNSSVKIASLVLVLAAVCFWFFAKRHSDRPFIPIQQTSNEPKLGGMIPNELDEAADQAPKMRLKNWTTADYRASVSPVRNPTLSLLEGAEREAYLNNKLASASNSPSSSERQLALESIQAWTNEVTLRTLCSSLRLGMNTHQATNVLGAPSKIGTVVFGPEGPEFPGLLTDHTNGTWYIYSSHPNRIDMKIGDDFRVLELWFNPAGELADAAWVKPVRN